MNGNESAVLNGSVSEELNWGHSYKSQWSENETGLNSTTSRSYPTTNQPPLPVQSVLVNIGSILGEQKPDGSGIPTLMISDFPLLGQAIRSKCLSNSIPWSISCIESVGYILAESL